jgi:hypothetical protein
LEQICPPGGVLISGTAHNQLPGKLDVRFEYAGEQRLRRRSNVPISMQSVGNCWRGDQAAGPREYVAWLVDVLYLRRDEDAERRREGLRRAGLSA